MSYVDVYTEAVVLFQYVYRKTKQLTGNRWKKKQDLAM